MRWLGWTCLVAMAAFAAAFARGVRTGEPGWPVIVACAAGGMVAFIAVAAIVQIFEVRSEAGSRKRQRRRQRVVDRTQEVGKPVDDPWGPKPR